MNGSKKETECFITNESWVSVREYEGIYEVSNYGRVRSLDRVEYSGGVKRRRSGRILKQDLTKNGYLTVQFSKKGLVNKKLVHRLVCDGHVCRIEDGFQVNHKDSNKSNNFYENLESVTPKENMSHAKIHGRLSPFVSKGIGKKLTSYDVSKIREMRINGFKIKKISEIFGVSSQTIWNITNYRTWKIAD